MRRDPGLIRTRLAAAALVRSSQGTNRGVDEFFANRSLGWNGFNRDPVPNGELKLNNVPYHVGYGVAAAVSVDDSNVTQSTKPAIPVVGGDTQQSTARSILRAPRDTVNTSKSRYTVIFEIVPPANLLEGMNDGVRLIEHTKGERREEKRVRVSTDTQKFRADDIDQPTICCQLVSEYSSASTRLERTLNRNVQASRYPRTLWRSQDGARRLHDRKSDLWKEPSAY